MKLVDMKLPKRKKKNEIKSVPEEENRYPWGLELRLEKESLEKLPGIKNSQVGDELNIKARVKVVQRSSRQSEGGGDNETAELQIIKMGAEDNQNEKEFEKGAK